MDKEEHHDHVQREAPAAGLLVGVLFLFGLLLWPAIQSPPPPPTALPDVSSD